MKDYEKIRNLSYAKDFSLEPMKKILSLLNHPEKAISFIHVAGTKGKTSVCHYLAELLQESGADLVGLYTSPHLESATERVRINGVPVSERELENRLSEIQDLARENGLSLTYFETLTAAALRIFQEKKVSFCVLETGLGGRLDATNAVTPILSMITPIDKDHTDLLGHTLFSIAREKGGILKPGIPFLLGEQRFRIHWFLRILGFLKKAEFRKSMKFETQILEPLTYKLKNSKQSIFFHGPDYGARNFALALSALQELGFPFPKKDFIHAVPGRFEIYEKNGILLVLDGAHNPFSAQKLVYSLKTAFPDKKWIFILNAFADKDIEGMVRRLSPLAQEFQVLEDTRFCTEKTLKAVQKTGVSFKKIGWEDLTLLQNRNYCVTGSFYLAGDFKKTQILTLGFKKSRSGFKFSG